MDQKQSHFTPSDSPFQIQNVRSISDLYEAERIYQDAVSNDSSDGEGELVIDMPEEEGPVEGSKSPDTVPPRLELPSAPVQKATAPSKSRDHKRKSHHVLIKADEVIFVEPSCVVRTQGQGFIELLPRPEVKTKGPDKPDKKVDVGRPDAEMVEGDKELDELTRANAWLRTCVNSILQQSNLSEIDFANGERDTDSFENMSKWVNSFQSSLAKLQSE